MSQNIKAFISLPISFIISIIILKICLLTLSELNDILIHWLTFLFEYIFTGVVVGFAFSFTYLIFANYNFQNGDSKPKSPMIKKVCNILYGYLFIFSILTVYMYGFMRNYSLINSKLLSFNENYFKFILIGIIIGIYGYFKKWKIQLKNY